MNDLKLTNSMSSRFGIVYYLFPLLLLITYRLLLPDYIIDDAYISLRTALHLADGGGFGFNAGEHIYVTTSPLWVILLAGVRLIVGDVILASSVLGLFFEAGLLILLVRLGDRVSGSKVVGMIAALLLVVNPVFIVTSGSGMEIALYLFIILLSVHLLLKEKYAFGLALAALTLWIRFDGVLIFAGAVVWSLYAVRASLSWRTLLYLIPSGAILLGYLLFGELVFDTVIPTSAQRKSMSSPLLLSGEWVAGAYATAREFVKVMIGKSGYWITGLSPLVLLLPFLGIGAWKLYTERNRNLLPLLLMTLFYVGGYVGSGSLLPRHFPWYFIPLLPLVCLTTGVGLARVASFITQRSSLSRVAWISIASSLVLVWGVVNWFAIDKSKKILLANSDGEIEREQVYAAGALWIGAYLGDGARVAACEIGTIGFFLPSHVAVLDTYGILRRPEELEQSYIEMIKTYRPEAVLARDRFEIREGIEKEIKGEYVWHRFKSLDIGLRSDLAPEIEKHLDALPEIYESVKLDKEPYSSREG